MASSALYRYFSSRDELLTALIIDAYNSLGEAAEAADAAIAGRADVVGRWVAVVNALRTWALDRPHEYALVYGSPVPGYAAPQDTVDPASRPVLVLGGIIADANAAGAFAPDDEAPVPPALRLEIKRIADLVADGVSEAVAARALIAWTEIFGAISFEMFGRLNNTIDERSAWFDHQARAMAAFIGIGNEPA
jgi:AcrR family transcriptional regulator